MAATSTLILGGGFGGLATAFTLRSLVPIEHMVTVVDKSPDFIVGATKTWVMLGDRDIPEITARRSSLLPAGVEFLQEEIQVIDSGLGEVRTSRQTLRPDFIVIALGAELNMGAVPGLQEVAHTFYTLEGAIQIREALKRFRRGELVILIPRTPFKCPPAPYEAAILLQRFFKSREEFNNIQLSICTVEPAPMPTAGPEMGSFIRGMIEERGIKYAPLRKAIRVDGGRSRIIFESGEETRFDFLIAIPPHEAPLVARAAGLVNNSGWIPVDPQRLTVLDVQTRVPVFAIGDIASVSLPGRFGSNVALSLPKAGAFAASQGVTVAKRIASSILKAEQVDTFDGKGFCYIETGDDMAMKGEGSFFQLPSPVMKKRAADRIQFKDKLAWVDDWLKGRISQALQH